MLKVVDKHGRVWYYNKLVSCEQHKRLDQTTAHSTLKMNNEKERTEAKPEGLEGSPEGKLRTLETKLSASVERRTYKRNQQRKRSWIVFG